MQIKNSMNNISNCKNTEEIRGVEGEGTFLFLMI